MLKQSDFFKKTIYSLVACLIVCLTSYGQSASSLSVLDTRQNNEPPSFYTRELKAEFKYRDTISVPGSGPYSALLTLAPWANTDNSGGHNHQLNFNTGGIFYRKALPLDVSWGGWMQLITTDPNGNVGIGLTTPAAKFEVFDAYSGSSDNFRIQYSPSLAGMVIGDNEAKLSISTKVIGGAASKAPGGAFIVLDHANASVGIGTSSPGATYKLAVEGRIGARSIKVTSSAWADYVFASDYTLMSLPEVEGFIHTNGHLPNVPSAQEVEENGFVLEEMDALLMSKVEELTLHLIQQAKIIEAQQAQINSLNEALSQLKTSEE
jgi:hypothetical protein